LLRYLRHERWNQRFVDVGNLRPFDHEPPWKYNVDGKCRSRLEPQRMRLGRWAFAPRLRAAEGHSANLSREAQPNDGNPSDAAPGRGADAERADDAWTRPPGQCHPPPAHNLGSDNRSRFGLAYLVMAQPIGFLFSISPCFKQTQEQAEWQLVTPLFLT
jgi:hypothetical protein